MDRGGNSLCLRLVDKWGQGSAIVVSDIEAIASVLTKIYFHRVANFAGHSRSPDCRCRPPSLSEWWDSLRLRNGESPFDGTPASPRQECFLRMLSPSKSLWTDPALKPYSELCWRLSGGRGSAGSLGYPGRHWQACSRSYDAACGYGRGNRSQQFRQPWPPCADIRVRLGAHHAQRRTHRGCVCCLPL